MLCWFMQIYATVMGEDAEEEEEDYFRWREHVTGIPYPAFQYKIERNESKEDDTHIPYEFLVTV